MLLSISLALPIGWVLLQLPILRKIHTEWVLLQLPYRSVHIFPSVRNCHLHED